jgi:hypothetical protein
MLVQYRHVEFNDSFEFEGKMYIKYNHNRGKLDPIRTSIKSKPEFRNFSKKTVVLIGDTVTDINRYMEVRRE